MKKIFPWILVASAVWFNHFYRHGLEQSLGHQIFYSLPVIGHFRYGLFLAQKWPLVILALLFFFYWLIKQKTLLTNLKENRFYILIIAIVLLTSHWFSFQRWFEFDDFRVIGHHNAVTGTPDENAMGLSNSVFYAIGMVYLVVRWFGTNFDLYNSLGLIFYFFTAVVIFSFTLKLQKNKYVALIAALFFITAPTYYRQTLQMQEFIGDGFSVLLFSLTNLMLVSGFYPGAILAAAATLEFGLSRTHFISLTLLLVTIFLAPRIGNLRKGWIISLFTIPTLTLFYLPVFINFFPESVDQVHWSYNFSNIIRISDSVFGVMVPHGIAFNLIWFLRWTFNHHVYISVACGAILVFGFLGISFFLFRKRKILAAKLVFIGIVTVVAAITFPTLSGIRVIQNTKDLTIQYDDIYPAAPTSYGVFSTFGAVLILIGLGQVVKKNLFRNLSIFLVAFNALTVAKSDIEWARQYSAPERAINPQMMPLIPGDGRVKVIYTPPPTEILSRYIDFFYQLYRIREPLYFTNDGQAFIDMLAKYKPSNEDVYVFAMDTKTYKVTDVSSKVRPYLGKNLTPEILKASLK